MHSRRIFAIVVLVVMATACGDGQAPEQPTGAASAPTVAPSDDGPMPSPAPTLSEPGADGPTATPGATMSAMLDGVAESALSDVTSRVDGGQPRVVASREGSFAASDLGWCQESPVATHEIRYHVVVADGDRAWLYVAGEDGTAQLCPSAEDDGATTFVPPPGFDQ